MGILDDAIREHLDLKRRRGADPTEVDQIEREALGPVRRGTQVSDQALLDEEHLDHEEHFDQDERLDHDEQFDHQEPFGEEEPFGEPPPVERQGPGALVYDDEADEGLQNSTQLPPEPAFADEQHEPFTEEGTERSWSYDSAETREDETPLGPPESTSPPAETTAPPLPEHPAESPPPARARRPAPPVESEEGPSEHPGQETVEYDVEAEHQGERKDDPLEETPEFLQDTPDHDRLWFEQRPPRPFDFDK
jgi:hypothetical protein